jgi:MoxR-like ATPase
MPATFTGHWKYLDDVGGKKILKPGLLILKPWQVLRERFKSKPMELLTCDDFTKLPGMEEIVKSFPVVVLYDEANRTNPWANGAFLEAMQEYKVTVDGVPIPLNMSCLFILTRNKLERGQTFDLPEAMQSRLALEDELLPPTEEEAINLLDRDAALIYQKRVLELVDPVLTVDELVAVREHIATRVRASKAMNRYIMQLVSGCLNQSFLLERLKVSEVPLPKGGVLDLKLERVMRTDYPGRTAPGRIMLTLKQLAKTVAYLHDSEYVRPEHLKRVFHRAIMHHIFVEVSAELRHQGVKGSGIARAIADIVLHVVDEPSD